MSAFQLVGLPAEPFESLFTLSEAQLAGIGARRVVANSTFGFPCRVSLVDADVGDELILLSYLHQPADSPYRASGPIFVRKGARQQTVAAGQIPDYVRLRMMSVRAYDAEHLIVNADVCDGTEVGPVIERMLSDERVAYIHLHNAKRGCFSCTVERAGT
jgi:hypothetical protein